MMLTALTDFWQIFHLSFCCQKSIKPSLYRALFVSCCKARHFPTTYLSNKTGKKHTNNKNTLITFSLVDKKACKSFFKQATINETE